MKQVTGLLLLLILLAASCHKRTAVVATPKDDPAVAAAAAAIAAGEAVYSTNCIKCHAAKPVGNWTIEQWQPILKSMVKKARLDSIQTHQVTAYVNANAKK